MKLLLDTHLLLWTVGRSALLSPVARAMIGDLSNELLFSAASLWEVAIKKGLGRDDFQIDPRMLRRGLLDHGYTELPITGAHAVTVTGLPPIHKDSFDRVLLTQSIVEGITLLSADPLFARYPALVRLVRYPHQALSRFADWG
jgi:PIN domain nuclease of toxin-antitoxin system